MITTCNRCQEDFDIKLEERLVKNNIYKVSFSCNHCNKEYISYYTNIVVRNKQKKINKIAEKIKEANENADSKKYMKLLKEYKKCKKEIDEEMEKLKKNC